MCNHLLSQLCLCLRTQSQLYLCCYVILPSLHLCFIHIPKSFPFISSTIVDAIHFIYHSTSRSCHLPQPIPFILLIIVHYFHIYHIWSYSCYIAIQSYFYVRLRNAILLKYTNSLADIKTYASKLNLASIKLSTQSK